MSSRFDPAYYALYRPFYPASTFEGFQEALRARGFSAPFEIADVGCGTGHSALSLFQAGIQARIIGVDPDPGMLEQAKSLLGASPYSHDFEARLGSGERTSLPDKSQDAVIVGSAFHWMRFEETVREFQRILRPGGLVRIFEYQFPKSTQTPELNEWIKREFNLRWKAPDQKPRGTLKELTQAFESSGAFTWLSQGQPAMKLPLTAQELTGLLLSQSRVLHYGDSLKPDEREAFRKSVSSAVHAYLEGLSETSPPIFDFKLAWQEFALRSDARGHQD